jgi:hypothetical protein
MEKVFIRIVAKTAADEERRLSVLDQNALGRDVASMLQEEDEEDELEAELKAMTFRERTCCCFTRFAHKMMAKYHCGMCCTCCCVFCWSILQCPCCIFFHWTACWVCLLHFLTIFCNACGACCLPAPKAED